MTHRELISERGGIRPLARSLGHRNHTTVQGWWERDRIPDDHLEAVNAAPVPAVPTADAA